MFHLEYHLLCKEELVHSESSYYKKEMLQIIVHYLLVNMNQLKSFYCNNIFLDSYMYHN